MIRRKRQVAVNTHGNLVANIAHPANIYDNKGVDLQLKDTKENKHGIKII
jgi:hypothetical protein